MLHTLKLAYADYQTEQPLTVTGEDQYQDMIIEVTLVQERDWFEYGLVILGGVVGGVLFTWISKRTSTQQ